MRVIVRSPREPRHTAAVAWDVDSTMWDFLAAFYDLAREASLADGAPDPLPATPPQGVDLWRVAVDRIGQERASALLPALFSPEVMLRYGPLPGAVEATHAVRDAGARIVVMTHRPPEAAEGTARFLDESGFHWDELRCGFDCKITACGELDVGVIVDDRSATLALAVERGVEALTLRWPHNADVLAEHPAIGHGPDYAALLPLLLGAVERTRRPPSAPVG